MVELLSQRVVGRMAAFLLVMGGCVSLLDALMPNSVVRSVRLDLGMTVVAIVLGVWAWFAPWPRWPRSRSIWLAIAALALLGLKAAYGTYDGHTYGVYFVGVFSWLGIAQPRGTSLKLLPVAVAAYVVPLAFRGESSDAILAVFDICAIALLVGETLAWFSTHLRRTENLDASRMWALQGLLLAGELLARQSDASHTPMLVADLGAQLLKADRVLVLLPEDEGSLVVVGAARWPESDGARLLPGDATEVFETFADSKPRPCALQRFVGPGPGRRRWHDRAVRT